MGLGQAFSGTISNKEKMNARVVLVVLPAFRRLLGPKTGNNSRKV